MTIVKLNNLSKHYGNEKTKVKALDNINLTINKGEFIAIVGSSGSGKSTLLHIIGGVDNPTSGKVFVNNIDVHSQNDEELSSFRRNNISIIYQFFNLIPILSVKENIVLPVNLDDKEVDEEYLNEIITMLDLKTRINHLPNELSGGQMQRAAIARALINKPDIILADEPTGNLDSKRSVEIINLLKEANKKYNQTIIMVTHDAVLAKEASRLITIEDGKIINDEAL